MLVPLIFCSCSDPIAFTECGVPCTAGLGACASGFTKCINNEIICEPLKQPIDEICGNKVDDNCDGLVDEVDFFCPGSMCINGVAVKPSELSCNQKDDDCDGLVDEVDEYNPDRCYEGPPGTEFLGECRTGIRNSCGEACLRQKLPTQETCNGKDDDCNGLIDDIPFAGAKDIIWLIDQSTSMIPWMERLQASILNAHDQSASGRYHWIFQMPDMLEVPLCNNPCSDEYFSAAIRNMRPVLGGNEFQLDALSRVLSFNLSDIVVVFITDEPPTARTNVSISEIKRSIPLGWQLFLFVAEPSEYAGFENVNSLFGDYTQVFITDCKDE